MARIELHSPVNIRKGVVDSLQEFAHQLQREKGVELKVEAPDHKHEKNWLQECIKKGDVPQVILAHATDFVPLSPEMLSQVFKPLPGRFPLRQDLVEMGFSHYPGILHPVFIIPFVMAYNASLGGAGQVPGGWEDLVQERYYRQVTLPEPDKPISQAVLAYLKEVFPESYEPFRENAVYQETPLEVIRALGEGAQTVGIASISFARMGRQNGVLPLWPREGAVCIPHVLAFSREAGEELEAVGDFLFGEPMQDFFCRQGFLPAVPGVEFPQIFEENQRQLTWENWNLFFSQNAKMLAE